MYTPRLIPMPGIPARGVHEHRKCSPPPPRHMPDPIASCPHPNRKDKMDTVRTESPHSKAFRPPIMHQEPLGEAKSLLLSPFSLLPLGSLAPIATNRRQLGRTQALQREAIPSTEGDSRFP